MKINLGSGQRPFAKPWTNVDCQERWNPDVIADGASMPMFEDGSAEMIVLHHVLEHFGCGEADALLKECHRILAPGGSLLIFIPDIRALAQRWLVRQMTDQIFFTNLMGAYMGDEADRHKWHYTFESLADTVRNCGAWTAIKHFDWREIPGADLARDFWILSAEVIK